MTKLNAKEFSEWKNNIWKEIEALDIKKSEWSTVMTTKIIDMEIFYELLELGNLK